MSVEEILENIAALPAAERDQVAAYLADLRETEAHEGSVSEEAQSISQRFPGRTEDAANAARRREEEIRLGTVKTQPHAEVMQAAHAALRCI